MSGAGIPLVLASSSPRRRELLARLGIEVIVASAGVDETPVPGEAPAIHALRVAALKTRAVVPRLPGLPVLGADTVVALGDRILGKPADPDESRAMLLALAGRTHVVVTALALAFAGAEASHIEQARVTFVPRNDLLLDWYVATGEGDDKAGAYAVQGRGALLVERVEGNVQAVIGLPLAPLPDLFARVGLTLGGDGPSMQLRRRD